MPALSTVGVRPAWKNAADLLPGLALSAALALVSIRLAGVPQVHGLGLSGLSLAIVLGMLVGNTAYGRVAAPMGAGVWFSKQRLLRLGIVLYGFRLTLQDVASVGVAGVLIDALVVGSTFALAAWAGTRWLGLERESAMLIGAGSSICGAAAVLAAEPVVKGRAEHAAVAVATVVVFGTLGMFLYPALFRLNEAWGLIPGGPHAFGVYVGSTLHEVAQVVVAGDAVGAEVAHTAVIAKMVRVMLLAPFLIALSAWLARNPGPAQAPARAAPAGRQRLAVPWFALGFVAVVLFNSLQLLPAALQDTVTAADDFVLAMAMAALGLTTHARAIQRAGLKPLALALLLFVWLVLGGALLNAAVVRWLG